MRRIALAVAIANAASLPLAPAAQAAFGLLPGTEGFEVTATEENGSLDNRAGSHPYALTTEVNFNLAGESPGQPGVPFTDGDVRDLRLELPLGLMQNPTATAQCTQTQFHTPRVSPYEASRSGESCPDKSQVGVVAVHSSYGGGSTRTFGVFNLVPPPGVPSELGFNPYGAPIALIAHLREAGAAYGFTLGAADLSQLVDFYGFKLTLWGAPGVASHDSERGNCLDEPEPAVPFGRCSVNVSGAISARAYLTWPTSCAGPMAWSLSADSWQQPNPATAGLFSHYSQGEPLTLEGCEALGFQAVSAGQLTNSRASSASGFHFELTVGGAGVLARKRLAPSQLRKAVVSLPAGITVNPSLAAGLGACTPAQYESEAASTPPGAGCPNDSKIGDFTAESPLLEGIVNGSIFLAQPDNPATTAPGAENPFDSLLALYMIARSPERGLIVKAAGKVAPNLATGQLTASFEDLPQLPYTHLNVHFREGQRAPLITPAACGSYTTQIDLTPWSGPGGAGHDSSQSPILSGLAGSPCPAAATPPFQPAASAGTLNSYAGAYTPFYLHLTRTDSEQEITSYSAALPPGLLGRIAGVPFCPDADIEAAKAETGTEEEEHPSCPASSEIGHTYTGYGVGGVLAYAPGKLYLAGPYHGAPLSIVAIDSAKVGPFDLGVIVVRSAIDVNPRSAQVSIDSAGTDPIPHIRDGIPLHLRDIRVYVSRPDFTLNPTSCEPFSVTSTLTGSSAPFTDPRDASASATDPFQVRFCSSLRFAPELRLRLKGGTRRGDYPSLRATVTPHPGEANIAAAAVTLPPTEFLEQGHIREVCTRPQLEAEACPPGSVYGHASATTPLLEEPLRGPVYLRSNGGERPLPDLVAVLHGRGIRILLEGRIDSSHGGLRASFEGLPDAPVSKFTMTIAGGRKRGLLVNAANLCASPPLAIARFLGHNDSGLALRPRLGVSCPRRSRKPRGRGGRD